MQCPLCETSQTANLKTQNYLHCQTCDLRFLDPSKRLNRDEEKARYLQHQNDHTDQGYQNFLQPVIDAVRNSFPLGARGLDFGSGPEPVLSAKLQNMGYAMDLFDPFFHPNPKALQRKYDFIIACEVVEHFYNPAAEFARLASLLEKKGKLVIMTLLCDDKTDFENWHYRRDSTHVCFYSQKTFAWLKNHFGFHGLVFKNERLILMSLSAL